MAGEKTQQVPTKRKPWVWVLVAGFLLLFLIGLFTPPTGCWWSTAHGPAARTRAVVQSLQVGLAAFKSDWGVYPPSSPRDGGAKDYGYQNLAYYLMGPTGEGWGAPVAGELPFSGKSDKRYGPYFMVEHAVDTDVSLDAFRPPKPILYFRFAPDRDSPLNVHDNPVDPTCKTGFASQEHFELSAKYRDDGGRLRWQREDYLLISPGPDRLYGCVVEDEKTGDWRPATREDVEAGRAVWDDVTNF